MNHNLKDISNAIPISRRIRNKIKFRKISDMINFEIRLQCRRRIYRTRNYNAGDGSTEHAITMPAMALPQTWRWQTYLFTETTIDVEGIRGGKKSNANRWRIERLPENCWSYSSTVSCRRGRRRWIGGKGGDDVWERKAGSECMRRMEQWRMMSNYNHPVRFLYGRCSHCRYSVS